VFDLLLSKGADVNLPMASGITPLMTVVQSASKHRAQWLLGG
jgi:ankyrin repeat protein